MAWYIACGMGTKRRLQCHCQKKHFYYVCLALPLPRRAQCHKMEPLSLRGTTFCFQMIILAFFPDLRSFLTTFSPPKSGSKPITAKKNQNYHVRLALPTAEEGPVSQDGTSFPKRHHLFFQLITPAFFRFVALFGHFFPNQLANLSLLKKTFPLAEEDPV